jgi:hypothetical protein
MVIAIQYERNFAFASKAARAETATRLVFKRVGGPLCGPRRSIVRRSRVKAAGSAIYILARGGCTGG